MLAMKHLVIAAVTAGAPWAHALVPADKATQQCRETSVLILGAGVAGITAAQTLHNQSIDDFLIIEYHGQIGGRMRHTDFGKKANGSPFTVELGANWVQGLGTPGGPENPIWTLAKKYGLVNTYSNYSSILTYNETGYTDFSSLLDDFEGQVFDDLAAEAGYLLSENILDQSTRAGLTQAGWYPNTNMAAQATEWWEWDWETAYNPEESSHLFGIAGYNATFYQYSDENNYVFDQRGFNYLVKQEAASFLKPKDPRLLLNTVVTNITYSDSGVTIHTRDGRCFCAAYALNTFSLGVLQHATQTRSPTTVQAPVKFHPDLPKWKKRAIANFAMGTYTKVFYQFDNASQFWPADTQYFLYADPTTRGYYPVWQSLSGPGFLPGSGIIFATVVGPQSARIEAQSADITKAEGLAVLRKMFPNKHVPEPKAFLYPRWGREEWAFGSYSNWPTGVTLRQHQNLRANVGRLWFAGEATSAEYFGFLHGAYFEGQSAAKGIAACLKGKGGKECGEARYEKLVGDQGAFTVKNGWTVTTFQTNGL